MTFLTFTVPRGLVFNDDDQSSYRRVSTVRINARNIVSVEICPYSDHTDLLIKTVDGDTWVLPGTAEHLAQVDRLTSGEVIL